jgi:hypothetical protein
MVCHEIDTDTMEGMRNADMVSVFLSVASGKVRRDNAPLTYSPANAAAPDFALSGSGSGVALRG